MEVRSLQVPIIAGIPSSSSGRLATQIGLKDQFFVYGQAIKFTPNFKNHPHVARKLKLVTPIAQASGTAKISSKEVEAVSKAASSKDENLVFVAGATGKVGSRTVRELLKLGFKVRAGVRSAQRAEPLLQSVRQMKVDVEVGTEGSKPIEKLEIVECDLERQDQIGPALGNASVVICCIGASEKEVFDITGPYRIDYQATKNLVDAATSAKVDHFILVTSLGTNKFGFPAAILNLFWGVLCWKRKAEEALLESGLAYTIVRPGGMERPTDAYKETHNITLSEEDKLFGGQVSNLQVAELLAFMAKSRSLSYCKVVEVIAETTAPLTPLGDLLARIPSQRAEIKPPKEPIAVDPQPLTRSVPSTPEPPPPPPAAEIEKEPVKAERKGTSSLSPYIMYEDLKPPTSPSPTPSTSSNTTKTSNIEVVPAESQSVLIEMDVPVESQSIPVEKEDTPTEVIKKSPQSPYTAYEDLKPPTSPSPIPSGPKEVAVTASTAEVVTQITGGNDVPKIATDVAAERNLPQRVNSYQSPYHAYDDLKPPTSPTPIPSGPKEVTLTTSSTAEVAEQVIEEVADVIETKEVAVEDVSKPSISYQSPYYAYEDLKPPTSPIPIPSGPKEATLTSSSTPEVAEQVTEEVADVVETKEIAVEDVSKTSVSYQSPYYAYDDLKPLTSPSPSAPTGSIPSQSSPNSASAPATIPTNDTAADIPEDGPKPRPLSPFSMYEDLKPPVSPGPPRI